MTYLRWMSRILSALVVLIFLASLKAAAESNRYGEPFKVRATVYTAPEGTLTKSGVPVRDGIVAGKKEWLGCGCIIYDSNMRLIGIYEFKDTGSHLDIKTGNRIDIYRDSLEACDEWIATYGDYVYIQVIKGDG